MNVEKKKRKKKRGDFKFHFLGRVLTINEHGKPVVTIGNSVLTGEVTTLKNPLTITERETEPSEGAASARYRVVSVVTKKIVFKVRPTGLLRERAGTERVAKRLKADGM